MDEDSDQQSIEALSKMALSASVAAAYAVSFIIFCCCCGMFSGS